MLKPGFASKSGVLSDISASAAMSPIAMVRDFDVSMHRMSTLSLKLKVSQESVLRRILSQSLHISLFESFAGIVML